MGKTDMSRFLSGKWGDTFDLRCVNPPALEREVFQAGRKW